MMPQFGIERQVKMMKNISQDIVATSFSKMGRANLENMCAIKTASTSFISVTKDGKFILDADDECSNKYIPYLKIITALPTWMLNTDKGFYNFVKVISPVFEKKSNQQIMELTRTNQALHDVFKIVSKWEATRREILKKKGGK